MSHKYDAVVIGAGLGGLSAAAFLSRKGRRVLLLEKHNVPGGYATSFVRGRFEFEVALHELSGIGRPDKPGGLYHYLEYLGVAPKVEFLHVPDFYRSVFPDLDLRLPVGREAYTQTLCDAFPQDADGIRRFLDRLFALNRGVAQIYKMLATGKVPPASALTQLPLNGARLARYALCTWGQVLNRDVQDPRARAVLSQIWGYFGLPPSRVSYPFFAMAMASYIADGPTYVRGRSQALAHAFADVIQARGSDIRFNATVTRIATQGGRVTAVHTADGDVIETNCVVSNVDPITTCRELIGVERVPASFWRRLRSSTVAPSSLNVYLGLAASPKKLGLTDHEMFINSGYDYDEHYRRMKQILEPGGIAVTCYNAVWPEISPPDTSMVVLTTLLFGEPWLKVPPADYVDTKNRLAEAALRLAEQAIPKLRDFVEVVEVSTPITNMRYAGQLGGSIYGFEQPPGDAVVFRLPHWGPLSGLYFAGAWTMPGGGFEPAIMSGRMAGEVAHRRLPSKREGA
jgi:prolycopene isomerase